jgi:hypothetical protein
LALIKCDECGADVSDKAAACPKCGNPIHTAASVAPDSPASSSPGAPLPPLKPKASAGRKLGGALAAFLVVVIAFMAFEGRSSNKPADALTLPAIAAASTSDTTDANAAAAASAAAEAAEAAASAAAVQEAGKKCALDLQCTAEKYSAKANGQCERMIEDHAREIAKWDYKVEKEHWYVPFTSKISWSGPSHSQVIYYGDQAKFQNAFGAWQRQSYWCVFDIASLKVTAAQFDMEGTPPIEDLAPGAPPPPGSSAMKNSDAGPPAETSDHSGAGNETITASFDCKKAHSTSEMLICGDAELAALDLDLAQLYNQAKAAAPDKTAFATATTQNWNWREHNCRDKACLVNWYADQKQRFENILSQSAQSSADDAAQPAEGASASL